MRALQRDEVRRTFVVILDDANMQFRDFRDAQTALLRVIDEDLTEGDMIAVVRTSIGSGAAEILTFDRQWLHRTVERMVWRPPIAFLTEPPYGRPTMMPVLMQALRSLRSYPGRKSILLVSPGYVSLEYLRQERSIADTANRSSVTIETVDVRGLPTLSPTAATRSGVPRRPIQDLSDPLGFLPDGGSLQAMQHLASDYFDSQRVLQYLAGMTAGRFQHENNDLYGQMKGAVDDSVGYYLVGWYPGADAFTPKRRDVLDYHHIQIRVRGREKLTVRTRDGFFSWPGSTYQPVYSPSRQMREALFSSFATGDIDVRMTAVPGYDVKTGAYVDSLLHILPKGVVFRDAPDHPGCKSVNLEILSTPMSLDPFKEPPARMEGQAASFTLCGGALATAQQEGFAVTIRDQMTVPGPYQMRVAVRNVGPNDTRAVEPETLLHRDAGAPERIAIGSANEIIEVPDVKKQDFVLTGVTMWGDDVSAPQPGVGATFRPLQAGDPEVREFPPGAAVKLAYQLVRNPKTEGEPLNASYEVVREGKVIFASAAQAISGEASQEMPYRLDPSWGPGEYLLGFRVAKPGSKSKPQTQWIDFEITK